MNKISSVQVPLLVQKLLKDCRGNVKDPIHIRQSLKNSILTDYSNLYWLLVENDFEKYGIKRIHKTEAIPIFLIHIIKKSPEHDLLRGSFVSSRSQTLPLTRDSLFGNVKIKPGLPNTAFPNKQTV